MNDPRILFVTPYYKPAYVYGGPTRSAATLCEGLARAGVDLTVLTTDANGDTRLDVALYEPQDVDGVNVIYYPLGSRFFFYAPELVKAIKAHVPHYDLVVIESLWLHSFGFTASVCRKLGIPYVVALRGKLMPWALQKKPLKKQLYMALSGNKHLNNAAALHCTIAEEEQAVKKLSLKAPTFVVANAVDLTNFEEMPQRGFFREKFGISDDAFVLLFLGRLFHVKRPDIAVDTLSAVRSSHIKAHLILAGPDSEDMVPALQAQARELGVDAFVHFTGLLEGNDVLRVLADADLLLMPSEVTENFGRSAAEAMAAGLPVIVSKGISIGSWAVQAQAGMQVDCNDEAFAQAALALLSSPDALPEMGERGAEIARREFASDAVARKMLAQYRSIIQTGLPLDSDSAPQPSSTATRP